MYLNRFIIDNNTLLVIRPNSFGKLFEYSIKWCPAILALNIKLFPNTDVEDVWATEATVFFFIDYWCIGFCIATLGSAVLLGYWISPTFEGCFFWSCCKIGGISANRLCWRLVANIRLDGFRPMFFINALPLCFCRCRGYRWWLDYCSWSNEDRGQAFHK